MSILCLGEAWGEHEERERTPFVGYSGLELTRMLSEAGIDRASCHLTNVFNLRPPSNKIEAFCGGKDEAIKGYPALIKGKFIRTEFLPELTRLAKEIMDVDPNLVICLGNTALWAMCGITAISKFRGSTRISSHTASGFKCLPTYHPAAVLRQWELRPVTVVDLQKACREALFPEIRRPKREIFIPEKVEDLYEFRTQYIPEESLLSVDIETSGTQITCIGFSPRPDIALVVPIVDQRRKDRSYWPTWEDERDAIEFCRSLLEGSYRKIFQNGMYDIAFILRAWGLKTMNAEHDPMLLHHALQPESLKGLGFLGSVYVSESSWKQMRETHTIKRDN